MIIFFKIAYRNFTQKNTNYLKYTCVYIIAQIDINNSDYVRKLYES